MEFKELKLEIFIPESCLPALRMALRSVRAGSLGNYDSCLAYGRVKSRWRSISLQKIWRKPWMRYMRFTHMRNRLSM